MLAPAKFGFIIVAIMLVAALLSPLLLFFIELTNSPEDFIRFETHVTPSSNGTTARVSVKLIYNGSVKLTDFILEIYGLEINFGTIERGVYEKAITVTSLNIDNKQSDIVISFKIAGLYPLKITVSEGEGK